MTTPDATYALELTISENPQPDQPGLKIHLTITKSNEPYFTTEATWPHNPNERRMTRVVTGRIPTILSPYNHTSLQTYDIQHLTSEEILEFQTEFTHIMRCSRNQIPFRFFCFFHGGLEEVTNSI